MGEVRSRVLLLRRNWIVPAACAAIAFASYLAAFRLSWEMQPFAWLGILLGAACAILTAWRDAFPREIPAVIEVGAAAIRVEAPASADPGTIQTESIVEARSVPRPGRRDAFAFAFAFGIVPLCALLAWAVLGQFRGRLIVGADGFSTRWLFRDRFVAFRDVLRIDGRMPWHGGGLETIIGCRVAPGDRSPGAPGSQISAAAAALVLLASVT